MATEPTNIRDWSADELKERFGDKDHLVCPACESTQFDAGPQAGNSLNIRCENGHKWNLSAFGMHTIGNTEREAKNALQNG